MATADGPLAGTTVLDLSTVGPATRCSRLLADYGARVVKVGAPPRAGSTPLVPPLHAYSGQRGLERAEIDLKAPAGKDAFLRLVAAADVVLESFRPGVMDRLGVGYEAARAANPGIVYCSTSGYGQTGPHAERAGHDLNYLAVGGYLHMSGRDGEGRPALPGATVADIAAGGMAATTAILAALVGRQRTGEGSRLDVAVTDGVLWMLSLYVDEYLATGVEPGPGHYILTGRYACYDVYPAGDGGWLAIAAIEPVFWANLCRALGLDRWCDRQTDDGVQDEIRADLRRVFAERKRDEWVALLADADTCVAPVLSIPEAVADDQFVARRAVVSAERPRSASFRQLGPLLAGTVRRESYDLPDPAVTATAALLEEAGMPAERVEALAADGVIA
ncbi:MAG TPA: CaiB/BaiF CoA-transferase family protein [Acidimicrobiales bacterium]|nr:CaiB/BaiF CoA-transferase family protein [Acidimicrobiales bacterium]